MPIYPWSPGRKDKAGLHTERYPTQSPAVESDPKSDSPLPWPVRIQFLSPKKHSRARKSDDEVLPSGSNDGLNWPLGLSILCKDSNLFDNAQANLWEPTNHWTKARIFNSPRDYRADRIKIDSESICVQAHRKEFQARRKSGQVEVPPAPKPTKLHRADIIVPRPKELYTVDSEGEAADEPTEQEHHTSIPEFSKAKSALTLCENVVNDVKSKLKNMTARRISIISKVIVLEENCEAVFENFHKQAISDEFRPYDPFFSQHKEENRRLNRAQYLQLFRNVNLLSGSGSSVSEEQLVRTFESELSSSNESEMLDSNGFRNIIRALKKELGIEPDASRHDVFFDDMRNLETIQERLQAIIQEAEPNREVNESHPGAARASRATVTSNVGILRRLLSLKRNRWSKPENAQVPTLNLERALSEKVQDEKNRDTSSSSTNSTTAQLAKTGAAIPTVVSIMSLRRRFAKSSAVKLQIAHDLILKDVVALQTLPAVQTAHQNLSQAKETLTETAKQHGLLLLKDGEMKARLNDVNSARHLMLQAIAIFEKCNVPDMLMDAVFQLTKLRITLARDLVKKDRYMAANREIRVAVSVCDRYSCSEGRKLAMSMFEELAQVPKQTYEEAIALLEYGRSRLMVWDFEGLASAMKTAEILLDEWKLVSESYEKMSMRAVPYPFLASAGSIGALKSGSSIQHYLLLELAKEATDILLAAASSALQQGDEPSAYDLVDSLKSFCREMGYASAVTEVERELQMRQSERRASEALSQAKAFVYGELDQAFDSGSNFLLQSFNLLQNAHGCCIIADRFLLENRNLKGITTPIPERRMSSGKSEGSAHWNSPRLMPSSSPIPTPRTGIWASQWIDVALETSMVLNSLMIKAAGMLPEVHTHFALSAIKIVKDLRQMSLALDPARNWPCYAEEIEQSLRKTNETAWMAKFQAKITDSQRSLDTRNLMQCKVQLAEAKDMYLKAVGNPSAAAAATPSAGAPQANPGMNRGEDSIPMPCAWTNVHQKWGFQVAERETALRTRWHRVVRAYRFKFCRLDVVTHLMAAEAGSRRGGGNLKAVLQYSPSEQVAAGNWHVQV